MSKLHYGQPLEVRVVDGKLVIEIGLHTFVNALAYSDWANPFDEKVNDYIRTFAVCDPLEFGKDVQRAMLREEEDGSSPLSDFLDKMTQAAVDDGSVACEYEERIKHGTFAPVEARYMSARSGQKR